MGIKGNDGRSFVDEQNAQLKSTTSSSRESTQEAETDSSDESTQEVTKATPGRQEVTNATTSSRFNAVKAAIAAALLALGIVHREKIIDAVETAGGPLAEGQRRAQVLFRTVASGVDEVVNKFDRAVFESKQKENSAQMGAVELKQFEVKIRTFEQSIQQLQNQLAGYDPAQQGADILSIVLSANKTIDTFFAVAPESLFHAAHSPNKEEQEAAYALLSDKRSQCELAIGIVDSLTNMQAISPDDREYFQGSLAVMRQNMITFDIASNNAGQDTVVSTSN